MKRVCPPAPDSCHVSACSPTLGCTMTLTCVPDMTPPPPPPPPPADMATPPPGDMALPPSADMAAPPAPDMTAPPVVGDMAMDTPDLMGELPNPQRDGGVETVPVGAVPGADMAMTPGAPRTLHVHGSSVGGCAVGGGPGDLTLAALLLVVPFVLRRRRA
jgi:MYXO-CTERM domain-containing protein